MKKTLLSLSVAMLSACSQLPDDALLLSLDDQQVAFAANEQGLLVAEKKLDKGSYTFSIGDNAQTCGSNFTLAEDTRIKFNRPLKLDDCAGESAIPMRVFKANTYQFLLNPANNELTVKVKPKQSNDFTSTCLLPLTTPKLSMSVSPLPMVPCLEMR
ncbi:hypothetical protein JCM19239_1821 [Vibrio variabilis]|uniref:Lipoprotein n=1 Tax=Vibrio variabilis TaxID=990271 RepID=A0ABQ0JL08_9VIBR|nr:hypothetical protein JCM19239_1821 [Vibrio variabilis]